MNREYISLREITAAEIYNANENISSCFQDEFQMFLYWADKHYKGIGQNQFYFFKRVALSHLQKAFEEHPLWEKFLIEKGFISIASPTYSVGDKFIYIDCHTSCKYILAVVSDSHVLLISENGCNFYGTPPVYVKDVCKITSDEFRRIARNKPHLFVETKMDQENRVQSLSPNGFIVGKRKEE